MFWKIYFLYDFWCAQLNLFHSQPFLDYTNLTIAVSASDVRKFFYVYIYILGPKLLLCNFQVSQLSIRSGAHKLFLRLLYFEQFLTAISRILWRYLATKLELCSASERSERCKNV